MEKKNWRVAVRKLIEALFLIMEMIVLGWGIYMYARDAVRCYTKGGWHIALGIVILILGVLTVRLLYKRAKELFTLCHNLFKRYEEVHDEN